MIVTWDDSYGMGYYYFMDRNRDYQIGERMPITSVRVLQRAESIQAKLTDMPIQSKTYVSAVDIEFREIYGNDLDATKNMCGTEVQVDRAYLWEAIGSGAFVPIPIRFANEKFSFILLDKPEKFYSEAARLYSVNETRMSYVVITPDEHGGGHVVAFLTRDFSLYSPEYLAKFRLIVFTGSSPGRREYYFPE
jgi:hypothetical protein